tara:strand:+ start:378 stop:1028 length:651 start_codon:yes stop_codon:yes gene_type:complete
MAYKQKGWSAFNKKYITAGEDKVVSSNGIPQHSVTRREESPMNKNNKLKKAKKELEAQKRVYASLDTSNPYADVVNPYENMTVEQREADLYNQTFQAGAANTLQSLSEGAGSSGAANLAQVLSEEKKHAAQRSSVLVGGQEKENKIKEREFTAYIQNKKKEGEVWSRNANRDKQATLLGISQRELAAQREKIAASKQAKLDALQDGVETLGYIASS